MNFNNGIFRSERRRDTGDVPCTASSTGWRSDLWACLFACLLAIATRVRVADIRGTGTQ